jgi:hypothetical protein
MKHLFSLLLFSCFFGTSFGQTKPTEVLLLGTFHFNNPGGDVVKTKTMDIMAPKVQAELETITDRISTFHPDKIFVEWSAEKQAELDEIYKAYLAGGYEKYITTMYTKPSTQALLLKGEMVQLAFRAAKKAKLTKIYAFDYTKVSLPFDSVMQSMKTAHQETLLKAIEAKSATMEASHNKKIETYSLTQLLLDTNTKASLDNNKGFYLDLINRAGGLTNFAGPLLVSEWYRRNLYMHSIVQKTLEPTDDKAMILVGSGHAAMLKEFIELDNTLKLKELKDVLKK